MHYGQRVLRQLALVVTVIITECRVVTSYHRTSDRIIANIVVDE